MPRMALILLGTCALCVCWQSSGVKDDSSFTIPAPISIDFDDLEDEIKAEITDTSNDNYEYFFDDLSPKEEFEYGD